MKTLLTFLMTGLIWQNSMAQFTCDPAADCVAQGTAGTTVPDPDNCENYYVCILVNGELVPSTSSVPCADGFYYDQIVNDCSEEDIPGTCGPNVCPISICDSQCPSTFVIVTTVADKFNCSKYFVCLETAPVEISCPSNTPYYDGTTCVADASKCCDFCTAYCAVVGTQIVDPCDCTSYYICLTEGPPRNDLRFSCGSGTYYDETTASCVSGSCTSICSTCDGKTSTTQPPTDPPTGTTSTTTNTPITQTTTTTTNTPITQTTTTTSGNGCQSLESFTCPTSNGNFAQCTYCYRDYFHCSDGVASIASCSDNTVFNPNNQYPYCLEPNNCPYP